MSIGSIDNCAFGGFQLPGFVSGNSVLIKVYRASEEIEYSATATYSAGTGTFGDLFMATSELTLFDSSAGCTDINACNYDFDATIDDGSCEFFVGADYGYWNAGYAGYAVIWVVHNRLCSF